MFYEAVAAVMCATLLRAYLALTLLLLKQENISLRRLALQELVQACVYSMCAVSTGDLGL